MNKSNVMIENDTPIYIVDIYVNNTQIENVDSYNYWDRDIASETNTQRQGD